jgi:hypothetical protein
MRIISETPVGIQKNKFNLRVSAVLTASDLMVHGRRLPVQRCLDGYAPKSILLDGYAFKLVLLDCYTAVGRVPRCR